jgi:hypothetical protein
MRSGPMRKLLIRTRGGADGRLQHRNVQFGAVVRNLLWFYIHTYRHTDITGTPHNDNMVLPRGAENRTTWLQSETRIPRSHEQCFDVWQRVLVRPIRPSRTMECDFT